MAKPDATDAALNAASKAPLPPQAKAAVETAKLLRKAKNFWSIAREFLWGPFEKRASNTTALFMLPVAFVLDLLSVIPIVGDITMIVAVCVFFPWFLLLHYRFQKNIVKKFSVNILAPIVEAIPAISAFPAILGAVGFNLFQMRLEDWMEYKKKEEERKAEEEKEQEEAQRIARAQEIQLELEAQADEERLLREQENALIQEIQTEDTDEVQSAEAGTNDERRGRVPISTKEYKIPEQKTLYTVQDMVPGKVTPFRRRGSGQSGSGIPNGTEGEIAA